jgi:hypothetical protein
VPGVQPSIFGVTSGGAVAGDKDSDRSFVAGVSDMHHLEPTQFGGEVDAPAVTEEASVESEGEIEGAVGPPSHGIPMSVIPIL